MESSEGFQSFVPMSDTQQNFVLKNPLDPPLYLTCFKTVCRDPGRLLQCQKHSSYTCIEFKTRALLSDKNCNDNHYDDEHVNDHDDDNDNDDDNDDTNTNLNHSNNLGILKVVV